MRFNYEITKAPTYFLSFSHLQQLYPPDNLFSFPDNLFILTW